MPNTVILPPPVIQTTLANGQGPSGPPGAGGEHLDFTQAVASDTWTIAHNFGWRPNVQVLTTGGQEMLAEVLHLDDNVVQVLFDTPRAGSAICS